MWHSISLVGRVVRDPDTRYTPAGTCVSNITVAVDYYFREERRTIWIRVTTWEKLAEFVMEKITKGALVVVEGHLSPGDDGSPRIWTDKDGNSRASYEVTAKTLRVLVWKGSSESDRTEGPKAEETPKGDVVAPF